nr:LysR substrate-binding domain-containing protein [Pseudomonas umsongensis]
MHEMVSGAQTEALAASMIEVFFMWRAAQHLGFDSQLICCEPLLVVMSSVHPFAQQATIAVADLDQQPVVMYSPDERRNFYDCIVGLFAMAGGSPRYPHYLGQPHSILGLVCAVLGLAIVPAAARDLYLGHLQFRPLADAQPRAEDYMVSRNDNDSPALPPFLRMAEEYFRTLG